MALRAATSLGLSHIAQGLLCSEVALAQRLKQARDLLRDRWAGRALQMPAGPELPPRREHVLTVLSLMFHAGMATRSEGARAHERLGEMALARARLQEAVHAAPNDADARMLARRARSLIG